VDLGLGIWLTAKRKSAPVAWLVVTRGPDPKGAVDRIEPVPGESDEELALRVEDAAHADARAFKETETYFVFLFREGSDVPEARRPLVGIEAKGRHSLDEDEHGVLDITMRGMTEAHRTLNQLARVGLDSKSAEVDHLWARVNALEEREDRSVHRMRVMMLHEEELAERREERKQHAALWKKALEQVEILLPVGMSYLMHGREQSQSVLAVTEVKLLQDFVGMLTPEQKEAIAGVMDQIQRIALMELQMGLEAGTFAPEMASPLVQRVMGNLTREQVVKIGEILAGDEAKENAFIKLYAVRKHTLAAKAHEELVGQMTNGVAGELAAATATGASAK
jgi:hypothetical protein